jgi:hypothetical protein
MSVVTDLAMGQVGLKPPTAGKALKPSFSPPLKEIFHGSEEERWRGGSRG